MMPITRRTFLATSAGLVLASCTSGSPRPQAQSSTGGLTAEVASFDVVAGPISRLMVGVSDIDGQVLTGGAVEFRLRPANEDGAAWSSAVPATYLPIPGRPLSAKNAPSLGPPSDGVGVYSTGEVTIPSAGFWEVEINAGAAGTTVTAFEAMEMPRAVAVGQAAPATRNPTVNTTGVTPGELDSSVAGETSLDSLPYPQLHQIEIASALSNQRRIVVVVATPAYCTSKFCGPLVDEVAKLSTKYAKGADFVHLEVYADEQRRVSKFASEWIASTGDPNDGNEPWLFLVERDGRVAARFDNVVPIEAVEAFLQG